MADFWYVASPYSLYPYGKETAAREAGMAALELAIRGMNVFCPIAHSHAMSITSPQIQEDMIFWEKQDQPFLEACVGLIVVKMRGWTDSIGVTYEIEHIRRLKKPVMYLEWDDASRNDPEESNFADVGSEESAARGSSRELYDDSGTVVNISRDKDNADSGMHLFVPS
jgi:hypothetical protein